MNTADISFITLQDSLRTNSFCMIFPISVVLYKICYCRNL